ncbi:MAG: phosphatidate cytidylyltransferase [Rhodovibrionaceae bacterium]|nr:phosphatidate cytidylyltransferase [Rhodovibrionaceae bacterium]
MTEARDSLVMRVISALVLAPVVIAAVYSGGLSFLALVLLAVGLMAWEWSRLVLGVFDLRGVVFVASALAAVLLFAVGWMASAAVPLVIGLGHGFLVVRAEQPGVRSWLLGGLVYLTAAGAALLWLRHRPDDGLVLAGWLIAVVWATDIGAYVSGRIIGGPRLAPAVSPKKTWAGLAGGMLLAFAVGWISPAVAPMMGATDWMLALASAGVAAVAQGGDLLASLLKRSFGAKDASRLIPGHGGVLDRADGLLSAAVCVGVVLAIRELVL